tara:strand:+ start:740 stop:994 length:255 start_codon:yes stop_codon:yes gene_type:complete
MEAIDIPFGLTKRSIDVLVELSSLEGLTAYKIARALSLKLNLASSTTKFALKRLEEEGLVCRTGVVLLTDRGRQISEELIINGS